MRALLYPWNTLLVVVMAGAGLAGFVVLCNVVLPEFLRRARTNAEQHPARSFLIGLVNALFFGLIVFVLVAHVRVLRGLGLALATILLAFIVCGIAAIALGLGQRLRAEASATRQIVYGIVTLELAALLPLVGWIIVPLASGMTGLGAVILALFQRKPKITTG